MRADLQRFQQLRLSELSEAGSFSPRTPQVQQAGKGSGEAVRTIIIPKTKWGITDTALKCNLSALGVQIESIDKTSYKGEGDVWFVRFTAEIHAVQAMQQLQMWNVQAALAQQNLRDDAPALQGVVGPGTTLWFSKLPHDVDQAAIERKIHETGTL